MTRPDLAAYSHLRASVFERMLRVVHLVSFFTAGLSRAGQDVLWFTDVDDIAANNERIVELTNVWANVFSHYLQHDLRHVRCGTTQCDNGTLQLEDLASIPQSLGWCFGGDVDAMRSRGRGANPGASRAPSAYSQLEGPAD